jgi:RNA polymerase sigma factor (sigma-70 family)
VKKLARIEMRRADTILVERPVTHGSLGRMLSVIRRSVDPDASGPLADERLLARFAKTGDPSAFELLVWRHGAMVLGVCRRVLGDHHLAEDAFQATFLALARKPRAVHSGAALAGWLHRVAKRIAVRARTDGHKRIERDRRAARSELVNPPDVLSLDAQAAIDHEIDRLPEWQRRAVVLCYLDGHTTEQAAALLGVPRGTVLSRLAAARERLRRRLTKRGLALPASGIAIGLGATEASAALVTSTSKVVLGGGASVQVIGWAQGVLYAMFLSKIKLATAAVMTTGMLGAGVGWVAVPGHGTGFIGEAQADDRADRQAEEAKRQRDLAEQAVAQAQSARDMAQKAKAELDQARADLDRATAAQKAAEAQAAAAMSRLKELQDKQASSANPIEKEILQLRLMKQTALKRYGPKHPVVIELQDQIEMYEQKLAKLPPSKPAERRNFDVEAAEARLVAAQSTLKRAQTMRDQGIGSQAELERAIADVKEAEARLAHLKNAEAAMAENAIALQQQLKDLLAQQMDREKMRTDQMVQLRTRLAQEEERLKAFDRQQTLEIDRLLKALDDGRSEVERLRRSLKEYSASHGAEHPETVKFAAALSENMKAVERMQVELNDRQDKALAERLKGRQIMIQLEEQAKGMERKSALEEQDIAAKRAALQDRLRQGGGATSSAEQRLADMERKLEAVARELNDLRREMKK